MPELVLLDSSVIIDVIQESQDVYKHLSRLIASAESGNSIIVISSTSRAELMCLKELAAQGMTQDEQNELISKWFNSEYIVERFADRAVCDRAAELRRHVVRTYPKKTLTPIDSIILATAEIMKVSQLISKDRGLSGKTNAADRKAIGMIELNGSLGNEFPEICLPEDYKGQKELDLDD